MSLALHELATNAVKFGALSIEPAGSMCAGGALTDGGLELQLDRDRRPAGHAADAPRLRRHAAGEGHRPRTGRRARYRASPRGRQRRDHRGGRRSRPRRPLRRAEPPLPQSAIAPPLAGPRARSRPARIEGLRVLIVEDALLLALELEAGLTEAGAMVVGSAADLDEAMAHVAMPDRRGGARRQSERRFRSCPWPRPWRRAACPSSSPPATATTLQPPGLQRPGDPQALRRHPGGRRPWPRSPAGA